MLLNFPSLVEKYKLNLNGCLHVGAHFGEEMTTYQSLGINKVVFIEPCWAAWQQLLVRYDGLDGIFIIRCALGEEEGEMEMFIEKENKGQSNSLLKPKLHLQQHPGITFTEPKEKVSVVTMDSLQQYDFVWGIDFLVMDVQGYEGYVLRGGKETLKGINAVYTEVNRAEVYENCTLVEELDNDLLKEFTRVETLWVGNWGDALYIRKTLLQ